MPAIPLPFIVTGLLVFVLIRMIRRQVRNLWFLLFVGACAVQTAFVGLRWSVDLGWIGFVQPVFAACLPPLARAAFVSLRGGSVSPWHGLWPLAIAILWWLFPPAIDPVIIVEFLLYGGLILGLRFPGDVLTQVRLGDEWTLPYARNGVAALLILSALVDTVVSLALAKGDTPVAGQVIAGMMGVILVGLAGGVLAKTVATIPDQTDDQADDQAAPDPSPGPPETEEEHAILTAVEAVLAQGLYRDYDLTLQRLSRKTRIPARKISQAVNHLRGCSVTDLVNGYRVREAMRLLQESDLPITQIMLEAGFQTKSNFNRAFNAIAGQTPTAYRQLKSE
jgi:AraC-like DNA-binding protein